MARVRLDAVCASAVDLARQAAVEVGDPDTVGELVSTNADGERLVTHRFSCTSRGYRGWHWAVTVARPPRAKVATVCEVDLVAGPESLLAPPWLPWSQRVKPGDLGPGDVLPRVEEDDRLVQGFEATGDDEVDQIALWELGLGRQRVLSRAGRSEAGERWAGGDYGPDAPMALQALRKCRECGFLVPMAGALRQGFAVCTNEWSPADGRVVSLDYGCGAHSETELVRAPETVGEPVVDELAVDLVALPKKEPAESGQAEPVDDPQANPQPE